MSDLRFMGEYADRGDFMFQAEGQVPERYTVMITAKGLALADGELKVRETHRFDVYLHRDYPRRPPVITWLTPVFHPNLLGPERNGGVCIGKWSASESLADLCVRMGDLVSYRSFNCEDPLDREAAAWLKDRSIQPRVDVTTLSGERVEATDLEGITVA
jgi:hypothetical protein